MASLNVHRAAAHEFEQLGRRLLNDPLPAWGAVLAFYAALHWVDAYLATRRVHPQRHRERLQRIASDQRLSPIGDRYKLLLNRSIAVRYEDERLRSNDVQDLLDRHLGAIRQHIQPLLP